MKWIKVINVSRHLLMENSYSSVFFSRNSLNKSYRFWHGLLVPI